MGSGFLAAFPRVCGCGVGLACTAGGTFFLAVGGGRKLDRWRFGWKPAGGFGGGRFGASRFGASRWLGCGEFSGGVAALVDELKLGDGDFGVDRGSLQFFVAEQLLDEPDVGSAF